MAATERGESGGARWTREQDKAFENALTAHPEDSGDRWERIAADVPGKSVEDVKRHYELLVEDVDGIESGRVPVPSYPSSSGGGQGTEGGNDKRGGQSSKCDQERMKGIAWTEDEHWLFLLGLEKYGKGDWRSISRNLVISRTPTQVASHAQKYFIRLNSMNKDRRRTSIHDITTVASDDTGAPQGPITGQANASAATAAKSAAKYPPQAAGVGVFGAAIGQPVVGGAVLMPAVGTPVNLPLRAAPGIGYAVRPPVSGAPHQMRPSSTSSREQKN